MRTKRTVIGLISATLLFTAVLARAETAVESFAKGETLLAKGQFPAALQSYAAAARADRSNQEYMQHYAMVRRIVDLRSSLDTEKNPQRWEYMAKGLRAFYASERIYSELLKLDQEIHSRLNSADSAAMFAETQLALDQNAAAAKTLSLEPSKATEMTQTLLGIALVRSGKTDAARQIAERLSLPGDTGPSVTYAAARLHAATGDSAKAIGLLRACFEAIAPSQLEGFKSHAKQCPEFAAIASNPEFARALETKSKVPESKCSGGSSCAGCPMSGKCPKSQGKQ
jgi:tetratricopeptide (TPR) repeat protein